MQRSREEGCQRGGSGAAPASGYAALMIERASVVPHARCPYGGGGSAARGERLRCLQGLRVRRPYGEAAALPMVSACTAYGE
jgi:hypothetical protein